MMLTRGNTIQQGTLLHTQLWFFLAQRRERAARFQDTRAKSRLSSAEEWRQSEGRCVVTD